MKKLGLKVVALVQAFSLLGSVPSGARAQTNMGKGPGTVPSIDAPVSGSLASPGQLAPGGSGATLSGPQLTATLAPSVSVGPLPVSAFGKTSDSGVPAASLVLPSPIGPAAAREAAPAKPAAARGIPSAAFRAYSATERNEGRSEGEDEERPRAVDGLLEHAPAAAEAASIEGLEDAAGSSDDNYRMVIGQGRELVLRGVKAVLGQGSLRDYSALPKKVKRTLRRQIAQAAKPHLENPNAVKRAVILGGGPSGLMSALNLLKHGAAVTVIEQRTDYTRPIHFNVRQSLLDQLDYFDSSLVPKVLEKLGAIDRVEFVDATIDRKLQNPPAGIRTPDKAFRTGAARTMMESPSVGQIKVNDFEAILYDHLKRIQDQDLARGVAPRVRFFHNAQSDLTEGEDGNFKVAVQFVENSVVDGKTTRRSVGEPIDLGQPDLILVAEGANSATREKLGLRVTPTSPETRFVAGYIDRNSGGLIRRRYDVASDEQGNQYGVRQIVVGHQKNGKSWTLVEVPENVKFEDRGQIADYYVAQAAKVLEITVEELRKHVIEWGPNLFRLQQWIVERAFAGNNVILVGDAVGNAHFLTSGGVMTASVPHQQALDRLLNEIAALPPGERQRALNQYDKWARLATLEWARLGVREFGLQVAAVNFGKQFSELLAGLRAQFGQTDAAPAPAGPAFLATSAAERALEGHPQGEVVWNRDLERQATRVEGEELPFKTPDEEIEGDIDVITGPHAANDPVFEVSGSEAPATHGAANTARHTVAPDSPAGRAIAWIRSLIEGSSGEPGAK